MRIEGPAQTIDALRAQVETPCPKCDQAAGYWCRTPNGRLTDKLHPQRYWAAMARLRAQDEDQDTRA